MGKLCTFGELLVDLGELFVKLGEFLGELHESLTELGELLAEFGEFWGNLGVIAEQPIFSRCIKHPTCIQMTQLKSSKIILSDIMTNR